jgi:hypothetical protein
LFSAASTSLVTVTSGTGVAGRPATSFTFNLDGAGAALVENTPYYPFLAIQDDAYPNYGGTFGSRKVTTYTGLSGGSLLSALAYDITAPIIVITDKSQNVNNGDVTFKFTAIDVGSGLAAVHYGITTNAAAEADTLNDRLATPMNIKTLVSYEGNWSGLSNYTQYFFKVKAVDFVGNNSTASYSFKTHDRIYPVIETLTVSKATRNTLTARYKATDVGCGIKSVRFEWNPYVTVASTSTDGGGFTTVVTRMLNLGTYTATLTATDAANQTVGEGGYLTSRPNNILTQTSASCSSEGYSQPVVVSFTAQSLRRTRQWYGTFALVLISWNVTQAENAPMTINIAYQSESLNINGWFQGGSSGSEIIADDNSYRTYTSWSAVLGVSYGNDWQPSRQ